MAKKYRIATLLAALFCLTTICRAADPLPDDDNNPSKSKGRLNLPFPTTGGTQLWSDQFVFRDWRIQRNYMTAHCRLLDGYNIRHAWGTFEQCEAKFQEIRRDKKIEPIRGKVVIFLHGLGGTRALMEGICKYVQDQGAGEFTTINVTYASTREELTGHATNVAQVVAGFKDADEIYFVAHSMGNVILRQYMTDPKNSGQTLMPDPRIKRVVMLGPPNNGAELGGIFKDLAVFKPVLGQSAVQISKGSTPLHQVLATPSCEFGIIAGGMKNDKGMNPLINGDDDFVVGVEETKLPGARDFRIVPVRHRALMDDPKVREYTLSFLRNGYFVSNEERQPLP